MMIEMKRRFSYAVEKMAGQFRKRLTSDDSASSSQERRKERTLFVITLRDGLRRMQLLKRLMKILLSYLKIYLYFMIWLPSSFDSLHKSNHSTLADFEQFQSRATAFEELKSQTLW